MDRKSCSFRIPDVKLGQCSFQDLTVTKSFVIAKVCSGRSSLIPADIVDVLFASWFSQARVRRNDELGEELGIVATVVFTSATPTASIIKAVEILNGNVDTGSLSLDVSVEGTVSSRSIEDAVVVAEVVLLGEGLSGETEKDDGGDGDGDGSKDAAINSSQSNADVNDDDGSLSPGAAAGIGVGCVAVFALAIVMLFVRNKGDSAGKSSFRETPASYENAAYHPTSPANPRTSRTSFSLARGIEKANPGFKPTPAWPNAQLVLNLATETTPARVTSIRRNSTVAASLDNAISPGAASISAAVNPRRASSAAGAAQKQRRRSTMMSTADIDELMEMEMPAGGRRMSITVVDKQRRASSTSLV